MDGPHKYCKLIVLMQIKSSGDTELLRKKKGLSFWEILLWRRQSQPYELVGKQKHLNVLLHNL